VAPSRASTIRPVIQQRLSGSTTIKAGLRPKNLIGGGLLDPGAGRLVEDFEQAAGPLASLESRPPQGRDAGSGCRSLHDPQEPPGHAQAHPFGLGDGGELVLLVGGDLDGVTEPFLEGLNLGLPLGELLLQFVDAGLGRSAVHGESDLLGLAVERLA